MSAELAHGIAELERVLEHVLACFETERFPEPEAMDATWTDVRRAFEHVQAELGRSAPSSAPTESLERCQRLYAVATSVLSRRRDELAQERVACGGARRRLAGLRAADSGASCDVRG